jgi:hypothetical protein
MVARNKFFSSLRLLTVLISTPINKPFDHRSIDVIDERKNTRDKNIASSAFQQVLIGTKGEVM